jgi:hypothetical protein
MGGVCCGSATRLKVLAGSEVGAGVFINDTVAEEKSSTWRTSTPSWMPHVRSMACTAHE